MKKSESIRHISIALLKFQELVGPIKKSEFNPLTKSWYTPLDEIQKTIAIPLRECGLAVSQWPEGKNELTTLLVHESGEWMESTYEMARSNTNPQGVGSGITYQKRYALVAALSLCLEENDDDDANKAAEKTEVPQKRKSVAERKAEMKKKCIKTIELP